MNGVGGLAGWRWLLLCEGLPACALGLYTLYALPDRPSDARWLTDEQKDALEKRLSEESQPGASHLVWAASCRPAIFSLLPRFLQGAAAAAGMACVNSVGNLGGFFGPYMIGWLKDATGSFTAGLYGLAGMLTLAALSAPLIKLVRRDPPLVPTIPSN
jgi:hypothetical protein